jgi:ribosomal protein L11 methyltransferase
VLYPALLVEGIDVEIALALVDHCAPTAVDDRGPEFLVFFQQPMLRDLARAAILERFPGAVARPCDVDDEDWARRSQMSLEPVTIGAITVAAPWAASPTVNRSPGSIQLVIEPSMGFGTGHHATTRLCLRALQELDLTDKTVIDIGTGSGILALAAQRLGARTAQGIDADPDAIRSAEENLRLNRDVTGVAFVLADLESATLSPADVVVANLTGALLVRRASVLSALVRNPGVLILSGLMTEERDRVRQAFIGLAIRWEAHEDEWMAMVLGRPAGKAVNHDAPAVV